MPRASARHAAGRGTTARYGICWRGGGNDVPVARILALVVVLLLRHAVGPPSAEPNPPSLTDTIWYSTPNLVE
jgi:hypothetical protein